MPRFRTLVLSSLLLLTCAGQSFAEGFAMTEWSARGLGLAGGLVAREADPSSLIYNAAAITQLPGTQIMTGLSFIAPKGTVKGNINGQPVQQNAKSNIWTPPHLYVTHQVNDRLWLGLGVMSRFGLGNSYDENWFGNRNVYDVELQTFSVVPTAALKINDMFSFSLGLDLMYLSLTEKLKVPTSFGGAPFLNDMRVKGDSMGLGVHAGLHAAFNEQWSAGLSYKSQVKQVAKGDVRFGAEGDNRLAALGAPNTRTGKARGTVCLPDSLALAVAYKPLDNLSFELGTVWTRWSTYRSLNMYFDAPTNYKSLSDKRWKDGWNINASVEFKPLDWLALRAGYWHETSVIDEDHSDFMLPTNGRDVVTLGTGFNWDQWSLDLSYAHIWIKSTSYAHTDASGIRGVLSNGRSDATTADIFAVSVTYRF